MEDFSTKGTMFPNEMTTQTSILNKKDLQDFILVKHLRVGLAEIKRYKSTEIQPFFCVAGRWENTKCHARYFKHCKHHFMTYQTKMWDIFHSHQ